MSRPQVKERRKKKDKMVYMYYELKNDKLIRKLKKCPRCGSFMAHHKDQRRRWACGSCSYTEYIS